MYNVEVELFKCVANSATEPVKRERAAVAEADASVLLPCFLQAAAHPARSGQRQPRRHRRRRQASVCQRSGRSGAV